MERIAQKCKQCGRKIYFDGICISCRAENERNKILAFSREEIDEEISKICIEIKNTGELSQTRDLLTKLINYRDINTVKIADIAFEKKIFYPYELYKDASDNVINGMIEMLMNDDLDSNIANKLQMCLAAYGGEVVVDTFLKLEKNPRKWRNKLYVNSSAYAQSGGWSYDEKGKIIKINFDKCYPMVKGTSEDRIQSPVKIGTRTNERCSDCGCQIVNIMEIDGRDSRLDFLEIDGVIKAKCCPNCFIYSDDNFYRYTINGESERISKKCDSIMENVVMDDEINEFISNTYVLGNYPVTPRYAADWDGGSSVGGFAFWIQDCDIKICPDCGKPMKYLAQVQWDTVIEDMEGNAYIEICRECNVIALLHQQT